MPNFIKQLINTGSGEALVLPNFIIELIDTGSGDPYRCPI